MNDETTVTEVTAAPPADRVATDPDYAAFQAWKAAQAAASAPIPDAMRAPEYDDTDDADVPMISYTERDSRGNPKRVHRVKVSEWAAYERRHNL